MLIVSFMITFIKVLLLIAPFRATNVVIELVKLGLDLSKVLGLFIIEGAIRAVEEGAG